MAPPPTASSTSADVGFLDPARWLRVVGLALMIAGVLAATTLLPPHERTAYDPLIALFAVGLLGQGAFLVRNARAPRNATLQIQLAMLASSLCLVTLTFFTMGEQGPTDAFLLMLPMMISTLIGPLRWALGIFVVQISGVGLAFAMTTASDQFDETTQWLSVAGGLAVTILFQHRVRGLLLGATARLAHAANTDHLTGVFNRRGAIERIDALLDGVADAGTTHLLLCDIDHFKSVNDRYGHGIGDDVIVAVARAVQSISHPDGTDIVFRLGGEEFGMFVTGMDAADALVRAERLRQLVASTRLASVPELRVSVSVGIATLVPGDAWDTLAARADAAMYSAKAAGRDQVVAARPSHLHAADAA